MNLPSTLLFLCFLGTGSFLPFQRLGEDEPGNVGPVEQGFAVEGEPFLRVGVLGGDPLQEFDGVVTPFILSNGNLAVPTRGASSVRVFAPDGSFVKELGGPGEGPGEFRGLRSAWNRADTVEAWDSRLRRITRFLPGGELRVVNVHEPAANLDSAVGVLGEGWALVSLTFGPDGVDQATAHALSRNGEHLGELVTLDGMERHRTQFGSGPHPLSSTAVFGSHLEELFAATASEGVLRGFDSGGNPGREIVVDLERAGPPRRILEQVLDSAVARAEEDQKVRIRQSYSAYPDAEAVPVLWAFLVDSEGLVWVRPYDPFLHSLALGGSPAGKPGPGGEWLVVAPDGKELARVEMPPGLEPTQVTSDAVVGIVRDQFGVESVQVHRLRRSGSGGPGPA